MWYALFRRNNDNLINLSRSAFLTMNRSGSNTSEPAPQMPRPEIFKTTRLSSVGRINRTPAGRP